jgi:hypothetical protein
MHILLFLLVAGFLVYKYGRKALRTLLVIIGIFTLWKSGLLIAVARFLATFVQIAIFKVRELFNFQFALYFLDIF